MEAKRHWAWPSFTSGAVPESKLHIHLEQEYGVYIRDFARLLGRAYAQCPIPAVRAELAENLYEEETGKLSQGRPHAELFLEYPRGLGMDLSRFESVELLPEAASYRALVDVETTARGWDVAAAVTTIFLEGTEYERGELEPGAAKRPAPPLSEHPLVKHYGLPLEHLQLVRAHRMVEGDHRGAAWRIVLDHVEPQRRAEVVAAMQRMSVRWHAYRDAVAKACGVSRAGQS
ncbi:MAG: iron-containing redox enzyme family protein [Deltaproteobacteria bacterium]|nr:iron-containing redox enzyme family protein [Nannocystaceae bacterium]